MYLSTDTTLLVSAEHQIEAKTQISPNRPDRVHVTIRVRPPFSSENGLNIATIHLVGDVEQIRLLLETLQWSLYFATHPDEESYPLDDSAL